MIASKAKIFDTIVIHRVFWGGILWNLKILYLILINTVERTTIYNEKILKIGYKI